MVYTDQTADFRSLVAQGSSSQPASASSSRPASRAANRKRKTKEARDDGAFLKEAYQIVSVDSVWR